MAHIPALHASPTAGLRACARLRVGALVGLGARPNAAPAPAPPPTPLAFEEALLNAANTLFSKANLQGRARPRAAS